MPIRSVPTPLLLLVLGLTCTTGCDSAAGNGESDGGTEGDTTMGGGGGSEGGVAAPDGASSACLRYVDCIAAVRPSMLSEVEASVGEDGSCWDGGDSTRQACDEGCAAALAEEAAASPGEVRCQECAADADCPADRPICISGAPVGSHTCVECKEDADCGAGRCEASICAAVDEAACLDVAMSHWSALGYDESCVREVCMADVEAACTPEELCCMLEDGPSACYGVDLDAYGACVADVCAASTGCSDALTSAGACMVERCEG